MAALVVFGVPSRARSWQRRREVGADARTRHRYRRRARVAGVHPTLRVGVGGRALLRLRMALVLRLQHVTFSLRGPGAGFRVLGGAPRTTSGLPRGAAGLPTDPRGEGTRLLFNEMPKSETIEVPIHLDVNVPDREAALDRVLRARRQPGRDEVVRDW